MMGMVSMRWGKRCYNVCLLFWLIISCSLAWGGDSFVGLPDFPSGNLQFHDMLSPIMAEHERIKAAKEVVEEAKERIRVSLGSRYPELEVTMEGGREDEVDKDNPDYFNRINLRLSQLLFDFGKTDSAVEKARLELKDRMLSLQKVEQKFILDAALAYQGLHRAYMVLRFANESEENIRHQTGLEEIRVAEGSGYTTDVLQSKSQLASAVSRRLSNEGAYHMAESRFMEIFGTLPKDIETLYPLDPYRCIVIPKDIQPVLDASRRNNIDLLIALNRKAMAEMDLTGERRRSIYPDLNFTLESALSDNYNDIFGHTKEYKAMVTLRKQFNLGLTERNKIKAAGHTARNRHFQVLDQEKVVETATRMAWHRLKTAEATTETLTRQAELTAGFLELARKERVLGNRSLMDILAGETSLINARSDSYAAKIDISLAMFSLMETTGVLDLNYFKIE